MKQKGFTLIELLAVIVILAVIALIATPMILGVIDTAKRGSAESATLGYVEAVEKTILLSQITTDDSKKINVTKEVDYTVTDGVLTLNTQEINVDFKGDAPDGTLQFNADGTVKSAELTFASIIDKAVTYDGKKATCANN